ncbi:MAG: AAA family ATPase [Magnetococcus sp. YQC-3]
MLLTGGYQTKEIIYSSEQTIVYRGCDKNGDPVILKLINNSHPEQEQLARYRLEYEFLEYFAVAHGTDRLAGVVHAYELVKHHNTLMIVLEEIDGISLSSHLQGGAMPVGEFLALAVLVIDIVEQIHKRLVIHKDINPDNIIWNPQDGRVRIIDFGIAATLTREDMEIWNSRNLDGTPAYLSPEQTGRMNRSMDFRSDLYSLGATFYYLLTGEPPFCCSNTLELVHAHLARQPVPPHEKKSHIPKMLSKIILKLLAKEPEDRYQTISGVKKDFHACLEQWQKSGSIGTFTPGCFDISERFVFPENLFGRDKELKILHDAFNGIHRGEARVVCVTGNPGVGKSSLINEISRQVLLEGGFYVSGKFNQSDSNIPYGPIVHAFRKLMRQVLTESDERLSAWKERLHLISEAKRAIICRVIPEMEAVFGTQNQVLELPPIQLLDQFQLAFLELLKTVCQDKAPLVVFIDDLQWSDKQSLQLMERMMIDPDLKYFLLIIAYRSLEMEHNPNFHEFREYADRNIASEFRIDLSPLDMTDVGRLIAKSVRRTVRESRSLIDICMKKTDGNPFFLKQFMNSLYGENLLFINNGSWCWNLDGIRQQNITENVVDLIINKIKKLSKKNQGLLQVAACIGMTFDLNTLSDVLGLSIKSTAAACQELLKDGFLSPFEGKYKLTAYLNNQKVSFQFVHDRVYQAVYSLIEPKQRTRIHLKIGRLLQEKYSSDLNPPHLLEIANHLNISISLMPLREKYQLAELNLLAGRQAMLSTAHSTAFDYFEKGINIFGNKGWVTHYQLLLQLHNSAVEVAYIAGHYQQMLLLIDAVKKNAKLLMDSIKVQENKIVADTSAMNFSDALNSGLNLLRILGISLPDGEPSTEDIDTELSLLDADMAGRSIEWFLDRPRMTDLQMESALNIIASVIPVTAMLSSRWMAFLLICSMRKIIKYGHSFSSPIIVCDYAGFYLCGILDDIERGNLFGQASIRLLDKFKNNQYRMRIFFMYTISIRHWKEHYIRTVLPSYRDGISTGMEFGDIQSVSYIIYIYVAQSFFFGRALSLSDKEFLEYRNQLIALKSLYLIGFVDVVHQAVLNLMGHSKIPHILTGEKFNEADAHQLIDSSGKVLGCNILIIQLILRFLFRQFDDCETILSRILINIDALAANAQVPIFLFFDSLFHLAVFENKNSIERGKCLERVQKNQMRIKKWAKYAPMNLEQMVELVEAEQCRVLGMNVLAQVSYNKAIEMSRRNGFVHIEAIAFELAGRYYLEQGIEHLARYHLSEACYAYGCWGALAKIADLDSRFPEFFLTSKRDFHFFDKSRHDYSPPSWMDSTNYSTSASLDLPSIIKASQAISSEIDYGKLVHKLLHIVMENAGAQRGCLISTENNELSLLASVCENNRLGNDNLLKHHHDDSSFSKEIVHYVIRTNEFLVLDDASKDYKFANTDYIMRHKPKSILCLPLFHQDKVSRILYLENSLLANAFTYYQVEAIRILGTQASISLNNARAMKELKSTEDELLSYQQQLRNLARHQQMVLENEQKKISQAVHDELGSILTRIRMETEFFLGSTNNGAVSVAKSEVVDLLGLIDQAMTSARRIAFSLRPKTLDQCGLLPAIQWQASQFKNQFDVQIVPNSRNIRLDEEREISLFRIGQEAITNIVRHSGASLVNIYFDFNDKDIVLRVSDNGKGIKEDEITSGKGMGVHGIIERARQLSGTVSFTNSDTGGAIVEVSIPRKPGDTFGQ